MEALPEALHSPIEIDRDLIQQLDNEIARLPQKYRTALVLCDLEQQPRRQAAATLQIPEGTLSSRLAAGRKMLADRLRKRGVTLSVGAFASTFSILSRHAPAESLVVSTTQTAVRFCAGGAIGTASASTAVTLAQGVLKMMLIKKLTVGLVLLIVAASLIGAGVAVYGDHKARQVVQTALEGVWLVESVEDHGDMRDARGYQLVFKKDKFSLKTAAGKEQEFSGRYEIDPNKGPQVIDFIGERDGKSRRALFEVKGDNLRICMNEDPDGERPDRFVSDKRGKNDLLMILKRQDTEAAKVKK